MILAASTVVAVRTGAKTEQFTRRPRLGGCCLRASTLVAAKSRPSPHVALVSDPHTSNGTVLAVRSNPSSSPSLWIAPARPQSPDTSTFTSDLSHARSPTTHPRRSMLSAILQHGTHWRSGSCVCTRLRDSCRSATYTLRSKAIALDQEFAQTLQLADSSLDPIFLVLQQ